MPNLATKDGRPTGGVYGFAVMAIEVLKKMSPDYIAVAWDKPKTNIRRRREIYPEYKANRKPAPPDFYEQIPVLHQLLESFSFPFYEIDDHEADDIMATFANEADSKGVDTILVSSDHDLLQLVSPTVTVATMRKGLTNVEMFDPAHFEEVYGMTTDQFVDYKSLRGDPSDNLPGVAGVGEKTAKKLIADYSSLDGVYDNLDQIKGALHGKLDAGKSDAYVTKKLVILDKDVGLHLDWGAADVNNTSPLRVSSILQELEFRTLLKQLPENMRVSTSELAKATPSEDVTITKPTVIDSPELLAKVNLESDSVFIHTFSAGPVSTDLQVLVVSPGPGLVYSFDLTSKLDAGQVIGKLRPMLENSEVKKVGYDLKSSIRAFEQLGVSFRGVGHDVRIAAFLLNSLARDISVEAIISSELGIEASGLADLSPFDLMQRSGELASYCWAVIDKQRASFLDLPKLDKLAQTMEWPVIEVLARMEVYGIGLDASQLEAMSADLADRISDVEQNIYGLANKEFNVSSPSQLADVLFNDLKLPTQGIKKNKTGYSTAARELDKLRGEHPVADMVSSYREFSKLKSTYVDTLPAMVDDNSRLHTTFDLAVASTGRLSSHDPNLQNIPVRTQLGRDIRKAFVAKPGHMFISADYSQFELRLAAVLAGDDELIEAFNDGLDIHKRTAAQVHGLALEDVTKQQRRDAKVINFGILYGMSPHGLSAATSMSQVEAKHFIDRYFELRKPLLDYIEATKQQAITQGFVETMFGRRRPAPDTKSSNYVVREAALRAAVNMPIQGTEADIMKLAMVELDRVLDDDCHQLLQIHDSIMVEAPSAKANKVSELLVEVMENIHKLPVKLNVDASIADNWGELL